MMASDLRPPAIFKIPGMRIENVMLDVLHAVDLGLACHVLANIFIEVMQHGQWGNNQQNRSQGLQKEINGWYSEVGG